eukprot:1781790-Amphidinium_carterae.1
MDASIEGGSEAPPVPYKKAAGCTCSRDSISRAGGTHTSKSCRQCTQSLSPGLCLETSKCTLPIMRKQMGNQLAGDITWSGHQISCHQRSSRLRHCLLLDRMKAATALSPPPHTMAGTRSLRPSRWSNGSLLRWSERPNSRTGTRGSDWVAGRHEVGVAWFPVWTARYVEFLLALPPRPSLVLQVQLHV